MRVSAEIMFREDFFLLQQKGAALQELASGTCVCRWQNRKGRGTRVRKAPWGEKSPLVSLKILSPSVCILLGYSSFLHIVCISAKRLHAFRCLGICLPRCQASLCVSAACYHSPLSALLSSPRSVRATGAPVLSLCRCLGI